MLGFYIKQYLLLLLLLLGLLFLLLFDDGYVLDDCVDVQHFQGLKKTNWG